MCVATAFETISNLRSTFVCLSQTVNKTYKNGCAKTMSHVETNKQADVDFSAKRMSKYMSA